MEKIFLSLLTVFILISCNHQKKKVTFKNLFDSYQEKDNPKTTEHKDTRTKVERELDSIRLVNAHVFLNIIGDAEFIDPKKINCAPFNTMDFNHLVAYSYDGSHEQSSIEMGNMTIEKQIGLNEKQANKILSLFTKKSTYDPMASRGCFEPRLALVLYKKGKKVMQISVCMDCNNIDVRPNIEANEDGLSKIGRKGIIKFCKEIGFPYGELER